MSARAARCSWRTGSTSGSGCSAISSRRPAPSTSTSSRASSSRSSKGASSGPWSSRRSRPGRTPSPPASAPRGTPYARSVASSARSLLITILGDAVHAGKIDRNPAERRKGRRGRVRVKGRVPSRAAQQSTANVITPFHALCVAERCALLSGRDIDFVMNVFAAWTGVRWGELMAVEGWAGQGLPAPVPQDRHPHLRRGLAATRTRRRSLQVGPEGWLLPGPGPAALPRRPDALGDGQPPRHLLAARSRTTGRPARARTRHRPTTCSSARRAATRAAPTTPTTSSPQPPKASTPPARASAAPSTSPPSRGPASPSAAATAEIRPRT